MSETSLSPSESEAVASYSSILSHVAQASKSAASGLAEAKGDEDAQPSSYKIVGIVLAIVSGIKAPHCSLDLLLNRPADVQHTGFLIGASFVIKKKGLLAAQKGQDPEKVGEGHAYLKNWIWWSGMIMMVLGEICNFVAYAFADAILVTPLGALSVVICAILSAIFLKETLTLFGKIGCFLCIVGSTVIALNGPKEQTVSTIKQFQKLFLSPGFLVYGSVVIVSTLVLIFFVVPRFGKEHMLVHISICSLIGGLSVSCLQGLGAVIVTSIEGNNQFKEWFTYFLLVFVTVTLLTEINYLNKALELFNTSLVTPTYYVLFTFCTLVTSVILFQGFDADTMAIITVVLGFLVICAGITILQISKVDPEELSEKVSSVDRSSTLLLAASRSKIHSEKGHTEEEEPSVDALRGIAGIAGSIQRARSARRSMQSQSGIFDEHGQRRRSGAATHRGSQGLPRHQLYDLPASSRLHESKQQQHQHELQQHPLPDDFADKISLHSNRTGRSDSARSPQHTRPSPHIHFASASQNRMYPPGDPGQDSNAGAVYEEEDIPMSYMPTLAEEYEGGTGYRDPYARSAQTQEHGGRIRKLFHRDPAARDHSSSRHHHKSHTAGGGLNAAETRSDDELEKEPIINSPLNDHPPPDQDHEPDSDDGSSDFEMEKRRAPP